MKIEITSEKKVPILSRKEVQLKLQFSGATPKGPDVNVLVVEALKADKKNVVVKTIKTVYGQQTAIITAYVYDNAEALKKIEFVKAEKKKE